MVISIDNLCLVSHTANELIWNRRDIAFKRRIHTGVMTPHTRPVSTWHKQRLEAVFCFGDWVSTEHFRNYL